MRPPPKTDPRRPARRDDPGRRRVGRLVTVWAALTLGGFAVVAGLTVAYLVRRGRRLRDRLGPPRRVDWPEPAERPEPGRTDS